jgi:hypothetical protein
MAAEKEKKRRDPEREWPFWDRVEKTEGCWLWQGAHRAGGYGSVILNGRQVYAHRFAFEQAVGNIPEGYQVHHRCGNKLCVRPDHLELLTPADHARLDVPVGWNWGITHCRRGHEFTPENTAITSQGSRSCRECQRTYQREWRKRKREGVCTRTNGLPIPTPPRDGEREWPFWDRVEKTDGCWLWKGKTLKLGYGQLRRGGREILAHRYAYEITHGAIPEGLQIDHICRNRLCVNPAHLEAVTQQENIRRGAACGPRKTHCKRGHPRTPETIVNNGDCLLCLRKRSRDRWRLVHWGFTDDKPAQTHCLRGHLRTPENVLKNGGCVVCQRDRCREYARERRRRLLEAAPPAPCTHCRNGHLLSEADV